MLLLSLLYCMIVLNNSITVCFTVFASHMVLLAPGECYLSLKDNCQDQMCHLCTGN